MEAVVLQTPAFTEVITKSGIELTKAEKYAAGYAPLMGEILNQAEIIKTLDKNNPEDAAKAKRVSLDLGKICSKLEARKKEDKATLLIETRLIDGLFNVAESTGRLAQKDADTIVNHLANLEKERIANLVEQRKESLLAFGTDTSFISLDTISDEQFIRLLENEQLAFNARKEAAEKAELERVEALRIAQENRIAQEKKDAEERAEQKAENERLRLLAIEKEAELEKERRAAKKAAAELKAKQDAILAKQRAKSAAEAEKLKAIADKERAAAQKKLDEAEAERQKLASELKAKKEAEELAIQIEKERIEAEELEKQAKAKAALLAPDKEKVRALHAQLKAIVIPDLQSAEGKELAKVIGEGLENLIKTLVKESQKLV